MNYTQQYQQLRKQGLYEPYEEDSETAKAISEAWRINLKRDADERKAGFLSQSDSSVPLQLRTAIVALTSGMALKDWSNVAEAIAMLQYVELLEQKTEEVRNPEGRVLSTIYICPVCAGLFDIPDLVHCFDCDHHYESEGGKCHNCQSENLYKMAPTKLTLDESLVLAEWSQERGYKRGVNILMLPGGAVYEGGVRVK